MADTREFVAYHSDALMGGGLRKGPPYAMLSRKPTRHLLDKVVWVVEGCAGNGKRKQYFLRQRFDVDTVREIDGPTFRYRYSGTYGVDFSPGVPLSAEPWFPDFMKSVANFSIGVTTLNPEFRTEFERLTGRAAHSGR